MENTGQLFIAGFLGILLNAVIKINSINKRHINETFISVLKMYFKSEFLSLLSAAIAVIIAVFISDEFINIPEESKLEGFVPTTPFEMLTYYLGLYMKGTFVAIGYMANSIVAAWLGVTEKKLIDKAKQGGVQ